MQDDRDGIRDEAKHPAGPNPVPSDYGHVPELSPWNSNLGDTLFLNKLLLWNHPHLTGRHQFPDGATDGWQWPTSASTDPEG